MPTYEYRCAECGNEFEQFGRMSDPPVQECPQCHAQAQRKISGGAGLVFKGSGFYITDYRGEGYKKAAESDKSGGGSPPPASTGGDAAPKADSKPAPKSDSSSSGGTSSGGSSTSE
ncbi:MAG TPA: zinc ribbon domain-containing protein [Longimicrobium sp.]|nr:zinc ribbon domain-containing protein [Longimicrobium sp.]